VFTTREAWLLAAIEELRPLFTAAGLKAPAKIRVSCGFPGTGNRRTVKGECWGGKAASIFISPLQSDEACVLETLVHEVLHACLPKGVKHGAPFKAAMVPLGLTGKATATEPTPELLEKFKPIVKKIGPYPHTALSLGDRAEKPQTTRLLKFACSVCDFSVRVTAKWLKEMKNPSCWVCGEPMCDTEMEEG
jgi:hypothetical protein